MIKVFKASNEKAKEIVNNEHVKRFGEAKYYGAELLGLEGEAVLIVKGSEDLFDSEIFAGLEEVKGEEKEKVLKKVEEMEENAALGVNLFFG